MLSGQTLPPTPVPRTPTPSFTVLGPSLDVFVSCVFVHCPLSPVFTGLLYLGGLEAGLDLSFLFALQLGCFHEGNLAPEYLLNAINIKHS